VGGKVKEVVIGAKKGKDSKEALEKKQKQHKRRVCRQRLYREQAPRERGAIGDAEWIDTDASNGKAGRGSTIVRLEDIRTDVDMGEAIDTDYDGDVEMDDN
jgi:hypothetical protein